MAMYPYSQAGYGPQGSQYRQPQADQNYQSLNAIFGGRDVRFGANSPASMFRQNVIPTPGQLGGTVHPMMPQPGSPYMPLPGPGLPMPPMSMADKQSAIQQWNSVGQGGMPRHRSQMTFNDPSNLGNHWSAGLKGVGGGQWDNPMDNYNRVQALNRMMPNSQFSISPEGQPLDQFGNQVGGQQLHSMVMGNRMGQQNAHIGEMRQNSATRNAFRDAQRRNPSSLMAMASRGQVGQNALNALVAMNAPAPFMAFNAGPGPNQAAPQAPQNPMDQKLGVMQAIAPFMQHLPPESQANIMGQLIGNIMGGQPINVGGALKQVGRAGANAKVADKSQITAMPNDVAQVPQGVDPNVAHAQLSQKFPDWSPQRVNSAMAQAYPDWTPPASQHPFFGGIGQRVNPVTGQTEPTAMNPMEHARNVGDFWANMFRGAPSPQVGKQKPGVPGTQWAPR